MAKTRFRLNPEWESKFASQPEIKRCKCTSNNSGAGLTCPADWKGIYNKNNLHERTVYNRTFKSASVCLSAPLCGIWLNGPQWDDEKSIWNITLYNSQNPDEEYNDYAHFLISAAGGSVLPTLPYYLLRFSIARSLSNPNFQKQSLKGLSDFKGDSFHSAQWDHSVDLKNKKIALVGNGCSASQIVPVLSKDPSIQILNFMRSEFVAFERIVQSLKMEQRHRGMSQEISTSIATGQSGSSGMYPLLCGSIGICS